MSKAKTAVFLGPFIERIDKTESRLGEEGLSRLQKKCKDAFARVFREHVGAYVAAVVADSGRDNIEIAQAVGANSRSFISEAKNGRISLEKFMCLVELFGEGQRFPPLEERMARTAMEAMVYLREQLQQTVQHPMTREVYEYVQRATRKRDWWIARENGNRQRLQEIGLELCDEVKCIVPDPKIADLAQLDEVLQEWSLAYVFCWSKLNKFDGVE